MYDQVLDHFRNAAEAILQLLQELLRKWTRRWPQIFGVPTLRGQFRLYRGWYVACAAVVAVVFMLGLLGPAAGAPADESDRLKPDGASFRFPTVPPEHEHVRALLGNALRYVDPTAGLFDKVSGYPVEGWNQDPGASVFPPLLHPVDRHRPCHGAARLPRRRRSQGPVPLPGGGPDATGEAGRQPAAGSA